MVRVSIPKSGYKIGRIPPFPLPFSPSLPPFDPLPYLSPPFPPLSLPLEVGPLNPAWGYVGSAVDSTAGSGAEHFSFKIYDIWWPI